MIIRFFSASLAITLSVGWCPLGHAGDVRELTAHELRELHDSLLPYGVRKWDTIAWETDILKARDEAQRVGLPIFMWSMDGHPLGCTSSHGLRSRASSFESRDTLRNLREGFIPLAVDLYYLERRLDKAGDFYRRIVFQKSGNTPNRSTRGFYVFDPSGFLIRGWSDHEDERMREELQEVALTYRRPSEDSRTSLGTDDSEPEEEFPDIDPDYVRTPPENGLVIEVLTHSRAEAPQSVSRDLSSRDFMWLSAREKEALLRGHFSKSLARRLARFHLVDNTLGHPRLWDIESLDPIDIELSGSQVGGLFHLRESQRSFEGTIAGWIEKHAGSVVRFDVVAQGKIKTEGGPTRKLSIAFRLVDHKDQNDTRIPPWGARQLDDYLHQD